MECGLVGDGEFVRPQGQAAPLLESGDAPLDGIALLVLLGVEAGRAASGAAAPQTVTDLVGGLRDDGPDAPTPKVCTDHAGRLGAIRQDSHRAGSRPPESAARDPDPGHDCLEGWRVTGLTGGDADPQRTSPAVTGQVDLCTQATAGASERVILGLQPTWRPTFPRSGRMLVSPADGGVHRYRPVHIVILIRRSKDRCQDAFPRAVHAGFETAARAGR